ncbi:dynein associated protein-domain-containing protein [Suillus subalutaceus]|uniref:dynein associated protein-domain-containing protein n=1 Tax=Suillus subalutaceus TaxID=48586 RepID=UPI001B87576E|nr:dynein associated protein-domain-containing protein [Suillus subalutaceus]KAG1848525.1 dynein associated protein-domain-containing protein [Suillus subalutaceus]
MDPPVGALVEVSAGRGIVRFSGATSFSSGKWIGIELHEPKGKNDGSLQGLTYFSCKPNHGVFVRPSQVKVINAEPEPQPPKTQVARTVMSHQRTPSTGVSRAASLRSNGASGSSSRSSSPVKATPSASTSASAVASPRTSRLTAPSSPAKRIPSLTLKPRRSFPRQPSAESSVPQSPALQTPKIGSSSSQEALVQVQRTSSPLALPPQNAALEPPPPPSPVAHTFLQPPAPIDSSPSLNGTKLAPSPSISRVPSHEPTSPITRTEDSAMHAKIRVLEAKRADDARHIRELETRLADAESFVALRPKLQAKLQSLQSELIATKRALADAEQLASLGETRGADSQEQLEMAMLDKEVAEEKAELAEQELEEVKERLAHVEVELGVMKEGGALGEDGDSNTKTSLAYIQLEKQNERLKEALIRLRDMSQETEQEQRRRIAEMEKDITSIDDLQGQYEQTLIKLSNAETQISSLQQQLDDALGAEDLLVQLTERNLSLSEKIEEQRITIEDLEALKELTDELEENHVQVERELRDEILEREKDLREEKVRVGLLEDIVSDADGTIARFREVVADMQGELDFMRSATQTAQHESATAAHQTATMMSLNLKLQSSAAKNQAKAVDLEIKKLEARERGELLGIVQPYLPQQYVESDSDATSCYLFFARLGYKTDLINTIVGLAHGLPDSLNGVVSETLVGICEMRGRAASFSTLCKRFASILRRCDPTSKRIDLHIDLLRRDEFREMEFVTDVLKMLAQFDHLAETYFDGFEQDLGERELGYALSFDHDLDAFAASIGLTKTSVAVILNDEDVVLDMGGYDPEEELIEPLQKLLEQCKSAKLAQQVIPHLSDARSAKAPFQLATVLSYAKQTAMTTVAKDMKPGTSCFEAVGEAIAQLSAECNKLLPLAMEPESSPAPPPWVLRIEEIRASMAINAEAERKAAQLQEEIQGLVRSLKTKDQTIQESVVKIEHMERRMEAAKKQADTIGDLEIELSKARKQERAYEEAMEQLQADLDTFEQDNAKLKVLVAGSERQAAGAQPVDSENVPMEGNVETSHLLEQIEALRGTVRFLRTENSYLKGQDLLKEIQALPHLPEPTSRVRTPPLDPSGHSDTDESDTELPPAPPTIRSLATETKVLYRDVIKFSSSPRVVDLSALHAKRAESDCKGGKMWMRKKASPAQQVLDRKIEAERLSRRVRGLLDRANAL